MKRRLRSGSATSSGGKDLECNLTVELEVEGTVDDAHAASADLREDFVVREDPPDHEDFSFAGEDSPP